MRHFPSRSTEPDGFTLVEILIVISIIGLLVVLVTPSVLRVRDQAYRQTCQSNQRIIQDAVDMYMMEQGDAVPPELNELAPYIRGAVPECPADGIYSLVVDEERMVCRCSIEDHNRQ